MALSGTKLLDKGGMPSDKQLFAMGIDSPTARGIQSLVWLATEGDPAARRAVEAMIDITAGDGEFAGWNGTAGDVIVDGSHIENGRLKANVTYEIVAEQMVGVQTSNGIHVKDVSTHVIERMNERQISTSAIIDAVRNPLKIGLVREDGSQQFIGEKATVAINTHTGKIVTVWPTKSKLADKLKGGK